MCALATNSVRLAFWSIGGRLGTNNNNNNNNNKKMKDKMKDKILFIRKITKTITINMIMLI